MFQVYIIHMLTYEGIPGAQIDACAQFGIVHWHG